MTINPLNSTLTKIVANGQEVSDDSPLPVSLAGNITIDTSALATEVTLQNVLTSLNTSVTELPPTPLMNPGDLSGYTISINDTAEHAVVALVSGQKVRVYRARIYVKGATDISILDAASGNVLEIIPFSAAGGIVLDFDSRPFWSSAISQTIIIKSSAAVQVYGRISYKQAV